MRDLIDLYRVKVSLFSAFSAASGFLLAMPREQWKAVFVFAGVFLLAGGSSGLNQHQERATDALMPRTKNRPIPSGRIKPGHAFVVSFFFLCAGFGVLLASCGFLPASIGLFASVWYNGVYTYLKRKSAFAAIPGALTGALPPAIGWTAAGGQLSDPRLLVLCLFFAIWQVPHFWLFIMGHGNEYEEAGLPSLTRLLRQAQIARIIFHWIAATAVSGAVLCMFGLVQSFPVQYLLLCASAWLIWQGLKFVWFEGNGCGLIFDRINHYMVIILVLLSADSLFSTSLQKYHAIIAAALK